jgi:Family of unknown function (DUF6370)
MKRTSLLIVLAGMLVTALAVPAFGAEKSGKEVTITGEGECAKCALHESDKCQTVIQAEVDGKQVKYYLAPNKVSKDFHKNVCQENQKVTATGTVKMENGKEVLTASKMALAK